MDNKLISIIMPVYNAEKYLEESINSILSQTYKNLEIIAVNDGSKDNSLKILEKISKVHPIIKIITIPNSGPSIARNVGIQHAGGDFITFLDADDVYFENPLEFAYKEFLKNPETEVIYMGHPLYCNENLDPSKKEFKKIKISKKEINKINSSPVESVFENKISSFLGSLIIKTECLKKIDLINPEYVIGEDFEFFTRVLDKFKAKIFPDRFVVKYRKNPSGLMNFYSNFEKRIKGTNQIINIIENYDFNNEKLNKRRKYLYSKKYIDFLEKIPGVYKSQNLNPAEKKLIEKLIIDYLFNSRYEKAAFIIRIVKILIKLTLNKNFLFI